MLELRFGRYFVLQEKVEMLFLWMEHNTKFEWTIEAKGICPHNDKLILSAIFASEEDFTCFEQDFLAEEQGQSVLDLDRRQPKFDWQASSERRVGIDRRQIHLMAEKDLETRRSVDDVKFRFKELSNDRGAINVCG